MKTIFKEFKPTIYFLTKFLGLYLVFNLLYGWYVESASPKPDRATNFVTQQSSYVLNMLGWETGINNNERKPSVFITYQNKNALSVYEGCNGINVVIVFVSFLFGFGPINKKLSWFIPTGILAIHLFNLARIVGLFFITIYWQDALYFTHKYLFTGIIYVAVFVLWWVWIRMTFKKA